MYRPNPAPSLLEFPPSKGFGSMGESARAFFSVVPSLPPQPPGKTGPPKVEGSHASVDG